MSAPTPDRDAAEREALADAMVNSDALADDVAARALIPGDLQREPFLMFADAILAAGWSRSPRPAVVSEEAVRAAARAFYIADSGDPEWAARAWDDMGGSEPSAERADLEISMEAALTAALPHSAPGQSEAEVRLAAVERALANHPDPCGKHPDDDGITCGWKAAVIDVHAALARTAPAEDGAE